MPSFSKRVEEWATNHQLGFVIAVVGLALTAISIPIGYAQYTGLFPGMNYFVKEHYQKIVDSGSPQDKVDLCYNLVSDNDLMDSTALKLDIDEPDHAEKVCEAAAKERNDPHIKYKIGLALEAIGKTKPALDNFYAAASAGDRLAIVKVAIYALEINPENCSAVSQLISNQEISALALYKVGRFEYLGSYTNCHVMLSKIDGIRKIRKSARYGCKPAIKDDLYRAFTSDETP